MLPLLPSTSLSSAQANNALATALVKGQGNMGSQWSDIYTDGNGNYAILWDNSIAPAFAFVTQDQSGNTLVNGVQVVQGDPATWVLYIPPAS